MAFTSWNGHAFFYKSARTVARCEPIGDRAQANYRGERKPGETPECKDWREWEGEVGSGTSTPRTWSRSGGSSWPRGTAPRWSAEHERCLRLRVRGGEDCVICAFHEDLEVLQAWMGRLGLPYRGQRLAGAAIEVFLHLLKTRRDPPGSRQAVLAEQDHQCKLCAAPITAATCELDHIVPVHQSFSRTGPEPPGPVSRVPPEQNGPGVLARHDAGVPLQSAGLRGLRGIAPAAPATSRSGSATE